VKHGAPSSIGIDTIYRSAGKVPEGFLRGAGVPETFIIYMTLRHVFSIWQTDRTNGDDFQEKAYVGGKALDNTGGKYPDFLLANPLTENTLLLEIKTPTTKLLRNTEYRQGVYGISAELAGSISQVLIDKDEWVKDHYAHRHKSEATFHAFSPQCLVVAGTLDEIADNKHKRRSFELLRLALKDVQVITYDELFGKVESLIGLFGGASS
jgi:hypothetical protein